MPADVTEFSWSRLCVFLLNAATPHHRSDSAGSKERQYDDERRFERA